MTFTSISFLLFIFAVFLIYWEIPHKFRYILLICANLLFCFSFGAKAVIVLLFISVVSFYFGLLLKKHIDCGDNNETGRLKVLYTFSIIILVFPLLIYKYLDFALYSVDKVLSKLQIINDPHTLGLIAPIGISFYTFESLSYLSDVYKGQIIPEKNFLRYLSYISYFPNITSGPIERANHFFTELDREKVFDYDLSVYGLRLLLLGMIKKVCGADVLRQYVDAVFGNIYAYKGPAFIVAILLYTYEIYLDFSGYTDMARGVSFLLGIELPVNFRSPYLSVSVKDFFARWHISLSRWLKDYIYIPLGGSRCRKSRKYINMMVTFLVSGIWHGASFTFIVWGLLHGLYQCMADMISTIKISQSKKASKKEKVLEPSEGAGKAFGGIAIRYMRIFASFVLVSFAWMFFRANSLTDAKYIIMNMFVGDNFYGQMLQMGFLTVSSYVVTIIIIALTIVYDILSEKMDIIKEFSRLNIIIRWVLYVAFGVLVVVLSAHNGAGNDFIYFRF